MKLKKILSLVLALALVLSVLSVANPHVHALELHEHEGDDCCPVEDLAVEELDEDEEIEIPEVPEEVEEPNAFGNGAADLLSENAFTQNSQGLIYGPPVYDEDGNLLYYEYYLIQADNPLDYTQYQLTDEQLALPTEELLELVLNSWLVELSFTVVSTPGKESSSYQNARSRFNGLREFESRPDAVDALLAKLAYYAKNFRITDVIDTCWSVLRFLLKQSVYLNQMSAEQVNSVSQAEAMVSAYEVESEAQIQSAVPEYSIQPQSEGSSSTLPSYGDYPDTMDVNDFTYDKAERTGTTAGYDVALYSARSNYSPSERQTRTNWLASIAGLTVKGNATSEYNCFSYAFYNRTDSNPYCVFDILAYLSDPHGFVPLVDEDHPLSTGDIIVYWRQENINGISYEYPAHVAVVSRTVDGETYCISKWGAEGLFEHRINQVLLEYTYDGVSQIKYSVYTYITYHSSYRFTVIDEYTHQLTCTICGYTSTAAHIADPLTGRCKDCKYKLAEIPLQPLRLREKKRKSPVEKLTLFCARAPKRALIRT